MIGLLGAVGISAAGIYVYLFRRPAEWSKFTLWLSQESALPIPYGLTGYRFAQSADKIWRVGAWLSLIFTAVCFYLWLSQLGIDPIRSMLGVWFLTWLPGLYGYYTTELGNTEPFGFALMVLAIVLHTYAPWASVICACASAIFLPLAPILIGLCAWSFWPLLALALPLYQAIKGRHVEVPTNAPAEITKHFRLGHKFGFGAGRSDQIRNARIMILPWGALALLFLYSVGQAASVQLLGAAMGALLVSYVMAFWEHRHTCNALLAACPVIACAVMCESLEWVLLAAFLQPFTASEGSS